MYGFLTLIGTMAAGIGFWWVVINFFRKKSKKRPALIFAAGFVLMLIGGAIAPVETPTKTASDTEEKNSVEEKTNAPEVVEQTQAEKDAEAAAKKKAEDEKVASEKAESEKKKVAEKDYYTSEIQSKVDTQMAMFDEAWTTLWVATFNGVSDGSVDAYTAYDNMKQLQQRYDTLYSSFPAISAEGLSEDNQKTFEEYKTNMKDASMWRGTAAEKAMKMFDESNFTPSAMDEVKGDVEVADGKMMDALIALTSLELELGIERE